jgi:AraC family transcriptional regulator of adaptative response/methylated-DNA-[protein]-cysteine methyltransferase
MNAQVNGAQIVDDPRWARVVARDRSADGAFFLSVKTTGVYCRPWCPARLPLPKNVRFHATAAEAQAAGFRACKRCKPDQPNRQPAAAAAGQADIRFAMGDCSLGTVLVASGARGLCAILIGDDPEALARELRKAFPRAAPAGDDAAFRTVLARVVSVVEAPARGHDLPLDLHGTAFQLRVWQALAAIPAGRTATYAEIARRIGAPKSVRAVATACAANPLAVAIPCHRVVRADGALSGYRWGVERKRILQQRETGR